MTKPKLTKQVFEIRYERGYRYLDRCGDVMLVFDELLPDVTGKVWMPEEISPTGARLKCPELELKLSFDATRMVVDQETVEVETNFAQLCIEAFSVLSARLDLGPVVRPGFRRFFLIATNATEESDKLSVRLYPAAETAVGPEGFELRSVNCAYVFETAQGNEGLRFSAYPAENPGAPETPDQRLLVPARLLPEGQKDALREQIKLRQAWSKRPVAGLMLDMDYYWIRPEELDLKLFFERGARETEKSAGDYAERIYK